MVQNTNNRLALVGRRLAKRLLLLQAAVAFFLIVFFAWLYGASGVKTAVAGSIISLVPNTIFAAYAFRFSGARAAPEVVRSFYAGEALKMIITIILFALAFSTLSAPWLPLFVVFSVLTFMHWLIPFLNLKSN